MRWRLLGGLRIQVPGFSARSVTVLSVVGIALSLAVFWQFCLRLLNAITAGGPAEASSARIFCDLVKQWGAPEFAAPTRQALATGDLVSLSERYNALKSAVNCGQATRFEEAIVSLALAETAGDCAKAYRGLEAVRQLRASMAAAMPEQRSNVLDLIEARLRLVLADAGRDPHQKQLAMAVLERAGADG